MTFQDLKLFVRKLLVYEGEGGLSKYHEVIDFVFFQNTNQYDVKFSRKSEVTTGTFSLTVS